MFYPLTEEQQRSKDKKKIFTMQRKSPDSVNRYFYKAILLNIWIHTTCNHTNQYTEIREYNAEQQSKEIMAFVTVQPISLPHTHSTKVKWVRLNMKIQHQNWSRSFYKTALYTNTLCSEKNTHSCFLLYLRGICLDLYKIFRVCLWGIKYSTNIKIKYSLLPMT